MSCLGVHFALSESEVKRLKELAGDSERRDCLQSEIEESYFADHKHLMCESDKAWDALHRCLTDGMLSYNNGDFPLNHVILGGEPLYFEDDYIMSLKTPHQVAAVASAMDGITESELRSRYFRLNPDESGCPVDEEDFSYNWHWFQTIREFYKRAAAESRHVLFTADQ
jgi:hypothetical protein